MTNLKRVAVVVLPLALLACDKADDKKDKKGDRAAEVKAPKAAGVEAGDMGKVDVAAPSGDVAQPASGLLGGVKVLSAGSGEKHSLQLGFQAGDKQSSEMNMDMDMQLPGGMPSISMRMKFGYDLEVLRVEEKG